MSSDTNTSPFAPGDCARVLAPHGVSLPETLVGATVRIERVGETGALWLRETDGKRTLYMLPAPLVARCLARVAAEDAR